MVVAVQNWGLKYRIFEEFMLKIISRQNWQIEWTVALRTALEKRIVRQKAPGQLRGAS